MRGLVPNCGLEWYHSHYNGRYLMIPESSKFQKSLRLQSFNYSASNIFNFLPRYLRDDDSSSLECWKIALDKLLENIPDCPKTPTLDPILTSPYTDKYSNSLHVAFIRLNTKYWKPGN